MVVLLAVDPLAEETMYPYAAMNNNPIAMIDPTGMSAFWVPKLNEDGTTSYVAEAGDSAATLSEQYGIDQAQAEQITGTTGSAEIAEGTAVSGEQVASVTGSDVLKLYVTSELATDQRIFDQFKFAREHSHQQYEIGQRKGDGFFTNEYYGNIGDTHKHIVEGYAQIVLGSNATPVRFRIPLAYNSGNNPYFGVRASPYYISNSFHRSIPYAGNAFGARERGVINHFFNAYPGTWGGTYNANWPIEYPITVPGPKKKTPMGKHLKH